MPRRSILRDHAAVQKAVSQSQSIAEALQLLGLRAAGGNYRALNEACERLGLEVPRYAGTPVGIRPAEAAPDEEVFRIGSTCKNRDLKRRLLAQGMPEICAECGIGPIWNEKPLVLQLDHANGIHSDNRLENLRLLCPNCHSQTETFTGRKNSIEKIPCIRCGHMNRASAQRCSSCAHWLTGHPHTSKSKIDWPSNEELRYMVDNSSFRAVGRQLGVSDSAVHKKLKG